MSLILEALDLGAPGSPKVVGSGMLGSGPQGALGAAGELRCKGPM